MILRAFQLQVLPNQRTEEVLKKQFHVKVMLPSKRGDILDRNGRVLATSVLRSSLYADPSAIKDKNKAASQISNILGVSRQALRKKLSKKKRFVWIKRKLDLNTLKRVHDLRLKGLGFLDEYDRVYPNGTLIKDVIGAVDIDGKGISGLEFKYDHLLRGASKKITIVRDGKGRHIIFSNNEVLQKRRGSDLKLTIDLETQGYIHKMLASRVEAVSAKRGWVVLMDVETGEIVSSAQVYNKNRTDRPNWVRNIAASEIHEPGSVLKTFSFLAALKSKRIKPSTSVPCFEGGFRIKGTLIRDAHEEDCEETTVLNAFSKSLNTVSSHLALKTGARKLISFYSRMGLDEKTGVDFPGEAAPLFHRKLTGPHHLASLSFGHGISVNSLQLVRAYAAFGNGGYLVTPHFARKKGTKAFKLGPSPKALKDSEVEASQILLSSVVGQEGTAPLAAVESYSVGGKTGTAQKPDLVNGGYSNEVIASFVGLFPLSRPKYVMLVSVDGPETLRSGGAVSAPLFSNIAEFVLRKELIPPDLIKPGSVSGLRRLALMGRSKIKEVKFGKLVPDFRGLSLREALRKAAGKNVKLTFRGSGRIVNSLPQPGKPMPKSKEIKLVLE